MSQFLDFDSCDCMSCLGFSYITKSSQIFYPTKQLMPKKFHHRHLVDSSVVAEVILLNDNILAETNFWYLVNKLDPLYDFALYNLELIKDNSFLHTRIGFTT